MNDIEKIYRLYKKAYTVTTDSRNVTKDCVFVALKGEHFDGNDFAAKVADDGVAACVIADRNTLRRNDRLFVVDDSLTTLQQLATFHRKTMGVPVLGITGTNGKTTTKELISAVLSKKYNVVYTQGNFNNHLGVPLTLLRIRPETELAVVEMGANHPGEIKMLADLGMPDYGIITNIGKAHLAGFGSFEGVIRTKNEMYQYISEHNGTLFVNADNPLLIDLSRSINNKVTYGTCEGADVKCKMLSANPCLSVEWNGQCIDTQLVGDYNVENVMAAVCVGSFFKVTPHDIVTALSSYCPTNNRSQIIKTPKNRVVMDAYNANPTSMSHAIRNFRNICQDDNLLILGDMRELGGESQKEHETILKTLKELDFKDVMLVGPEFSKVAENSGYMTFKDVDDLSKFIENHSVTGKDILVKGSNSIHLNKILDLL